MKKNETASVIYRDLNRVHYYLNTIEYLVTFRNKFGYTIHISHLHAFSIEEAEEQARLALDIEGYKSDEYETIKIERI